MNDIECEIIQISLYCDIVYNLIEKHKNLSIAKLIFFAYVYNKRRIAKEEIYDGHNKKDIVRKEISTINGNFIGFLNNSTSIIKAIDVLYNAKVIEVEGDNVHFLNNVHINTIQRINTKVLDEIINKSNEWTDVRFLKEVYHNV